MKSRTVPDFWRLFHNLPPPVQQRAYKAYRQWQANPSTKGLRFKRVSAEEPIYSIRIGRDYRALGVIEGDAIYWFFIGNHDQYEQALKGL